MSSAGEQLRVLIVEDSADDAALFAHELRKAGYQPVWERVETAEAMRAALKAKPWDIIISDYVMPGFGGMEALQIAKESGLDLPLIIISGKVDEETLVEVVKAGACDFLLKGHIGRLSSVIKRELAVGEARRGMRQAEIHWRAAFDSVRDPIFFHDADFLVLRANLAYAALGRMPVQEVIGKRYWDVFPRIGAPLSAGKAAMESGTWAEEEVRVAEGQSYLSRSFPILNDSGRYLYSMNILHDVTERNRVRDAVEAREHRFRALIEHASDLVVVVDLKGTIDYISSSIERLGGYAANEVLGKNYLEFVHPDDRPTSLARFAELLGNPTLLQTTEYRFRHKDGHWEILESIARNASADPLIGGIVINARVITERTQAQAALKRSERHFRKLIEGGADAFFVIDRAGKILYRSPSGKQLTGWSNEDVMERSVTDYVFAGDLPLAQATIAKAIRNPGKDAHAELRLLRKDGTTVEVEVTGRNLLADPDVGGIVVTARDISDRKHSEIELKRLNWAMRALSQSNSALVHAATEQELFESCCNAIASTEAYPLAWIGLAGEEPECNVTPIAAAGKGIDYLKEIKVSWADVPEGKGPSGLAVRTGKTQIIGDIATDATFAPWRERAIAHGFACSVTLPIRPEGKMFGALMVYSRVANAFGKAEVALFEELAGDIAYGIATRRMRTAYEASVVDRERSAVKLRKSLEDSIQAIAATVEARDPYTAGHEKRVAELATAIAAEMGLSGATVEGIHFGSLIHDLGKIRVPAEILSKPSRLSPIEFELIKGHAQAGYDILKGIDFPWPAAQMVLQHHERLDGSGYPQGLKGDAIAIEARVLAVADTVEAMASHRPYRPGLGIDKALAEIERGRGSIFDTNVVNACLRLFREKSYELPA